MNLLNYLACHVDLSKWSETADYAVIGENNTLWEFIKIKPNQFVKGELIGTVPDYVTCKQGDKYSRIAITMMRERFLPVDKLITGKFYRIIIINPAIFSKFPHYKKFDQFRIGRIRSLASAAQGTLHPNKVIDESLSFDSTVKLLVNNAVSFEIKDTLFLLKKEDVVFIKDTSTNVTLINRIEKGFV